MLNENYGGLNFMQNVVKIMTSPQKDITEMQQFLTELWIDIKLKVEGLLGNDYK
jgi:hypothetical protein